MKAFYYYLGLFIVGIFLVFGVLTKNSFDYARKDLRIQEKIIFALKIKPLERDVLAKMINVARTTVYENLFALEKEGLVKNGKRYSQWDKKGRPKTIWKAMI